MLAFLHNLLVRLLNFLKFFLCLRLVRIIDICIRMIRPAQLPVCLFNLVLGRILWYSQYIVWIFHNLFSSLLIPALMLLLLFIMCSFYQNISPPDS